MKYLFSIIFAFAALQTNSQSVTVQCNTASCFFTDPTPFSSSYNAFTNEGTLVGFTKTFMWEPTPIGAFSATTSAIQPNFSGKWVNQPNTPQRKIKVTVTWSKPGQASVIRSAEQVIFIQEHPLLFQLM